MEENPYSGEINITADDYVDQSSIEVEGTTYYFVTFQKQLDAGYNDFDIDMDNIIDDSTNSHFGSLQYSYDKETGIFKFYVYYTNNSYYEGADFTIPYTYFIIEQKFYYQD